MKFAIVLVRTGKPDAEEWLDGVPFVPRLGESFEYDGERCAVADVAWVFSKGLDGRPQRLLCKVTIAQSFAAKLEARLAAGDDEEPGS